MEDVTALLQRARLMTVLCDNDDEGDECALCALIRELAQTVERLTGDLNAEAVLWIAAIDQVPIERRIEWVKTMLGRVEHFNAARARILLETTEDC